MESKRLAGIIVVVVLAVSLLMAGYTQAAAKAEPPALLRWVGGTLIPPEKYRTEWFLRIVNEVGKGEFQIKLLGSDEIVAAMDVPAAVQHGVIEIGYSLNSAIGQLVPGMSCFTLSDLLFNEMKAVGVVDYIQPFFHKAGLHYLITPDAPLHDSNPFLSNKPVRKLGDFKGLKAGAPSALPAPFYRALGCEVMLIPLADMYQAIARNLIQGYNNSWANFVKFKDYEVAKYLLTNCIYSSPQSWYMNLAAWEKLGKKRQDLLEKAFRKYSDGSPKFMEDFMTGPSKKILKDNGVEFIQLPAEEVPKFYQIYKTAFWEAEVKKNPQVGAKLRELLTKK